MNHSECYLETFIDKVFGIELSKDPPNRLHEVKVHGLVIILEIDPSTSARDNSLPLRNVSRDDAAALLVVITDP